MRMSSKKGFSLVELIIVIAILGIIAVIAVPNLTGIQKNSQVSAATRSAEQIGKTVRNWLTDGNSDERNAREDLLDDKLVELSKLSSAELTSSERANVGDTLDKYVETTYNPGLRVLDAADDNKDAAYYVGLRKGKVVVAVYPKNATSSDKIDLNDITSSGSLSADDMTIFDLNSDEEIERGFAYIENVSKLNKDTAYNALVK